MRFRICSGALLFVLLAATVGCKKEAPAPAAHLSAKPPVHEQVKVVKFAAVPPAVFPNVQASPGGIGDMEWINGTAAGLVTKVKRNQPVAMDGWVANDVAGTVPPSVVVQLSLGSNSYYAQARRTNQKRSDVAKKTKNPAFEKSAFQLDADLSSVPPGTYTISFLQTDGKYIIGFDTKWKLEVQ